MSRRLPILVAAMAFLACCVQLGQERMDRTDDEGLYTQIAWEMHQRGDWMVPTWFGEEAYYKPPGMYWLMFPAFSVAGRSLLAGRLPSALAALATLWVVFLFARRAWGERAGYLAVALLASTGGFVKYARIGSMEALLGLAYAFCLYALYRAARGDGERWTAAFLAAAGASTLLKGPISALILGLTALLFSWLAGHFSLFRSRGALLGAAAGLALALAWPVGVALRGEWADWWSFFVIRENFGKFENVYYPPHNIWGMFLGHLAPWSVLYLAAVFLGLARGRWREPGVLLNLAFIASLSAVFTLPATRLTHYTVPALAEGALLIAAMAASVPGSRALRAAEVATGAVLLGAGGVALAAARALGLGPGGAWLVGAGLATLAAAILLLRGGRLLAAALCAAAAAAMVAGLSSAWKYPFVTEAARQVLAGRPAVVVRDSSYPWSWEAGHHVPHVDEPPLLMTSLQGGAVAVVRASDLALFERAGLPPDSYRVLERWPVLRRRLDAASLRESLRAGDPAPLEEEVLLLEGSGTYRSVDRWLRLDELEG